MCNGPVTYDRTGTGRGMEGSRRRLHLIQRCWPTRWDSVFAKQTNSQQRSASSSEATVEPIERGDKSSTQERSDSVNFPSRHTPSRRAANEINWVELAGRKIPDVEQGVTSARARWIGVMTLRGFALFTLACSSSPSTKPLRPDRSRDGVFFCDGLVAALHLPSRYPRICVPAAFLLTRFRPHLQAGQRRRKTRFTTRKGWYSEDCRGTCPGQEDAAA